MFINKYKIMNYVFLKENETVKRVDVDPFCYKHSNKNCSHTFSIWTSETETKPYVMFLSGTDVYNNTNIFNNLSENDKLHFEKYKPKKWWKCCFI